MEENKENQEVQEICEMAKNIWALHCTNMSLNICFDLANKFVLFKKNFVEGII